MPHLYLSVVCIALLTFCTDQWANGKARRITTILHHMQKLFCKRPSNGLLTLFWCLLLCWATSNICWGQLSKQTTQTIPISGAQSLRVAIPHAKLDFKETNGDRLIIEANIELSVPNETLLNFVINNGRYQLQWTVDPTTRELLLTSERDRDMLVVRGEVCQERVIYTIYIPKKMRRRS